MLSSPALKEARISAVGIVVWKKQNKKKNEMGVLADCSLALVQAGRILLSAAILLLLSLGFKSCLHTRARLLLPPTTSFFRSDLEYALLWVRKNKPDRLVQPTPAAMRFLKVYMWKQDVLLHAAYAHHSALGHVELPRTPG